jgi:hypothetical protein
MKIVCPRCGKDVPGADIDLGARLAVCRPCGEVVSLATAALAAAPPSPAVVYRPASLRWDDTASASSYVARVTPSRLPAIPLVFFSVVWDGFLVVWYAISITAMVKGGGGGAVLALLFPILHLAAGVFVTHLALVALFNRTTVSLDAGAFRVTRGPIPQRGNVSVALDQIEGFLAFDASTAKRTSWRIDVRTRDARSVEALAFDDAEQAAYVAQRLNDELVRVRRPDGSEPYR